MNKSIYILLALLAAIFFACKKDHQDSGNGDNTKARKISFAVKGDFTQQIVKNTNTGVNNSGRLLTITSDPATIKSAFDTIFYWVYSTDGKLAKYRHFSAKSYSTTLLNDTLLPGSYTVAIYFGQKGFNGNNYGTFPYGGDEMAYELSPNTYGSTFNLTVGATDVTQNVTINRIVADVDITITDPIPANAASITVLPSVDTYYFDPISALPDTSVKYIRWPEISRPIPASAIGTTNFEFNYLTFNTIAPTTITISCFDKNRILVAKRTIGPYTVGANEKLMLSGPLFNQAYGGNGTGIHLSVDTTWKATPVHQSF